jgi:hypothetical protein
MNNVKDVGIVRGMDWALKDLRNPGFSDLGTGFELIIPSDVYEFEPPTVEEIRLIREVIDPQGYFVKKKIKE